MKKRKLQAKETAKRALSCKEFAIQPKKYRSIQQYVREKLQRDMTRIFGQGLAEKRGSGGRARAGGSKSAAAAPVLVMPSNGLYLLERVEGCKRVTSTILDV